MASQLHRRQVLLFLAAILLPCAALVALGLRLVIQERELGVARQVEERRRVTRQLRQDLTSRLERAALRQAAAVAIRPELLEARAYDDEAVVLVAQVSGGTMVLPWEHDGRPANARKLLGQGPFAARVRQADAVEFADARPALAVDLLREALRVAEQPVQIASGRIFLARALAKAGRENAALAECRHVVTASSDLVDEHGIPIALYAARHFLTHKTENAAVLECLRRTLAAARWLPPPALYLLRDLAAGLQRTASQDDARRVAAVLLQEISGELTRTEQALALKADYPSFGLPAADGALAHQAATWVPYGTPAWLVGAAPATVGAKAVVVALHFESTLASVDAAAASSGGVAGKIALKTADVADAEPLGPELPGLVVRFRQPADAAFVEVGSIRSWSYAAALCLVIGVTFFGAYLLWRDVHREVRLAEMRSSFVAAVSHELKTPLTAIRMFAETLRMGRPADASTRNEYLDTIVNESERLTRLLNNVLDFSKIEQGTKSYRRVPQSLAEIVRAAARAMQYPLEQQHFVLRAEIEEPLPPARVDRDAIEQAILNLLANAMKYSGESRELELRLRSENGTAVIEVTDRGIGIEPAEHGRIFERFYRVSGPDNDRIPGTGLGLTLVQHIAEAHGGRVGVRSSPGAGSTFSLFIPLERVAP